MKNLNESKHGFWSALARKAKAILDDNDDNVAQTYDSPGRTRVDAPPIPTRGKVRPPFSSNILSFSNYIYFLLHD